MEYRIEPSPEREYVILKIVGDFIGQEMMQMVLESHALGLELGIHRYLVDVTEARNIDSILGHYNFAHRDMQQVDGIDPHARVAGLVSPGDHSHDFVVTVSANAGMHLSLFTELDAALDHLNTSKPSSE